MVRWKRGQSESESQSQNLSTRMVKRNLEDESTTTEEKTEDDVTHNAIIRSPPNVEVQEKLFKQGYRSKEEDADFLKQKKVVNDYRPGVVYQALRSIFYSKLNKAGLSYSTEKVVDIDDYVNSASDELNLVFVVGAEAHGQINEYTDDFISVSNYPLNAKGCIGLICESLEHKWKIF
ncbi:hypothetical protein COP2_040971 [Malus domestica]